MSNTKKSQKFKKGWIPNYHGAWAMIIIPVILGIIASGFRLEHILLLAFWWEGYFTYFAVSQWLHFRRNKEYFPAVKFYVGLLVPLGIGLALLAPYLVWWFILYLPIIAISIWAAKSRKDRHFLNDAASIFASGITLPIAYDLGVNGAIFSLFTNSGIFGLGFLARNSSDNFFYLTSDWADVWLTALLITAYFLSTVFFVKSLTRNRKSTSFLVKSVVFHTLVTLGVWYLYGLGLSNIWLIFFWFVLTIKSLALPLYCRKYGWLSIKSVGKSEIIFTLLAFVLLLF